MPPPPPYRSWYFLGLGGEPLLVQTFDAPRDLGWEVLDPMFVVGFLDRWLLEPESRIALYEIHAELFGGLATSAWGLGEERQSLLPLLLRAFERQDLVVLAARRLNAPALGPPPPQPLPAPSRPPPKPPPLRGDLSVLVVDKTTRNAIGGASVSIVGPESANATTDRNGVFIFQDLTPGLYTITATKAGFDIDNGKATVIAGTKITPLRPKVLRPLVASLVGGPGAPTPTRPAGPGATLFLASAPLVNEITVTVNDNRASPPAPIGQAFVQLTSSDPNFPRLNGVTAPDGTVRFSPLPPGIYIATAKEPGFADNTSPLLTLRSPPHKLNTNIGLCPTCPGMVIEINNTTATNDDLVLLKCDHPPHRTKTSCRIRAVACAGGTSTTVVLVNPDGRLRFPDAADTTKTLSLPADGSSVDFEISGETASSALGDAVIEAHCQTASGPIKATALVTVVSFDPVTISATPDGTYALFGQRYQVVGRHFAARFSARATIKPAGVDCSAPQISVLRIGLVQNIISSATHVVWNRPTIAWDKNAPAGTVMLPAAMSMTLIDTTRSNDTDTLVAPLYDQPGHPPQTLDRNSLKPPIGCAGGGPATSHDSPEQGAPTTLGPLPAKLPDGTTVGQLTYTVAKVTIDDTFVHWAVVFDTSTGDVCALRETTWALHADSTATKPQRATSAGVDTAPTMEMVMTGATGLARLAAIPRVFVPDGPAMLPFTFPFTHPHR